VVEGREQMPTGRALTTPYGQALQAAVLSQDPEWSTQRAQIRKAFTTGKDGSNIGALNTATVHLDDYLQAAQALKNGTFTPGNALYNRISEYLGSPAPTTFNTFRNAVAGELANGLKGNATDPEISHVLSTMSGASSPDQFVGNGKAALNVMHQKLNTYQERYNQQIPGDTKYSPVLPSASSVFSKYGISQNATPAPQRMSAADAMKLPKGTHFIGNDGQEYVR
jgi:hypothetical protein